MNEINNFPNQRIARYIQQRKNGFSCSAKTCIYNLEPILLHIFCLWLNLFCPNSFLHGELLQCTFNIQLILKWSNKLILSQNIFIRLALSWRHNKGKINAYDRLPSLLFLILVLQNSYLIKETSLNFTDVIRFF